MFPASTSLRVLAALLVLSLALVATLWVFQRRLIYFPDVSPVPPASHILPAAEDIRLTTSDGLELGAWYVPPTSADRDATVLIANGNGGNRSGRAPLASELAAEGFAVLLFDYRGYGGNPGRPTSAGLALDAQAAHRFLIEQKRVSPARMLYFGESLGTAVVSRLALEHPPAGLLLRSPFIDLESLARQLFFGLPIGFLLRDRFAVAEAVSRIEVPTTVVYGTADEVVPPAHSIAVAEAAGGPVELVRLDGAGHNDAVMFGPDVVDAVKALADRSIGRR
ncbi:alpha/beta hydrolase [Rhodococcus marinonascens]|uniref:alpha/beta hydrolase n=1 Tax=Rhodococcus marinonascens TaxID=38311 RepID=UPI000932AED4|nr:alpha/beta fold hydrolase [Rhodococcus marinonascens]